MQTRRTALSIFFIFLLASTIFACSVPVFRYALERWNPDTYRVVVFHRGALKTPHKESVEKLFKIENMNDAYSPLVVLTVDVTKAIPEEFAELWSKHKAVSLPHIALLYPESLMVETTVWSGTLTADSVEQLIQSPLRREVARRLVKGETAVWVLLKCGNTEKDKTSRQLLDKTLRKMEKELKLPHELDEEDEEYDTPIAENVELKIRFSVLEVDRNDNTEAAFLGMLLNIEDDLAASKEPMVFPVFGQGRALTVLMGKGINNDNIEGICDFLVGPCSCQVKAQNPGVDLLIPVAWDDLVTGTIGIDEALPPLTVPGAGPLAGQSSLPPTLETPTVPRRNAMLWNLFGLLAFSLAIVALLSWRMRQKKQ